MKQYVKWIGECAERVHLFGALPEITLTTAETPLFAAVTTTWNAFKAAGVDQVGGGLGYRSGAKERRIARDKILESMREIAEMAKGMEAGGLLPAGGEMFRMPQTRTFIGIASAAQAFADNAEPVKALFIERGLATTFVEDLEALLPELDTASGERQTGMIGQTAGTAGLEVLAKDVLRVIQQLRPIMRTHLKNQPALLEAWNKAARVATYNDPEEEAPAEEPQGTGAGGETVVG